MLAIRWYTQSTIQADLAQLARRSAFQGAKSVEHWERDDDAVTLVVDTLEDMIGGCERSGVLKDLNTAKLLAGSAKKVLTNAVGTDFGSANFNSVFDRFSRAFHSFIFSARPPPSHRVMGPT